MNAEQLLQHFERISEAPEVIPRLRRFILDLAVRGKLVEQDPSDEPAAELLKQIAAEKAWLVKTGEIRKPKPLAPIQQQPFAPPTGWLWLPLGETGTIQSGNSINAETRNRLEKTESGYPFIATKDVGHGLDPIIYDNGLKVPLEDQAFKHARAESILICAEGGSAGRKIGITDRDICFGNKLLANAPWSAVVPRLVMYVYMSGFFYEQFVRQMTGVIGGISIQKFLHLPFPLPPLAEQQRIVAKVDELMSLCDQLEAAKAEREQCRDSLVAASLQGLNQPAEEEETFREHARFTFKNLPRITTRAAHIKQLRLTILNLAVRGKLVPQDRSDEPAAELLKRIRAWQRHEIAKKKIRAPRKPLTQITNEENPYPLPNGWAFSRLGEIIYIRSGAGLTAAMMKDGPIPVYGGNGINGHHNQNNVDQPTIVVGRVGYYCGSIHVTPEAAWVTDNAFITHFSHSEIYLRFLVLLLNATNLKEDESATAQPVISGSKIYPIVVGLPPFAEQHRIVAKVDELMAICDQLEAQITVLEQDSHRFLEAVLNEALSPASAEPA